jgi:hypothetical protein
MPSSHPHQLSHIMGLILQVKPHSVLDIGVGFGKYGFLCREYLELWDGREKYGDWQRRIDGIEAFEGYITPLHRHIYDNIHIGNALEIMPSLDTKYDLILLINVLGHFDYEKGIKLLTECMKKGKSILISTPKQTGESRARFGNPFESVKFKWDLEHFGSFPVRHVIPNDKSLIVFLPVPQPSLRLKGIKNLYLIYALRRSGQHAVLNWMCKQSRGGAIHFNNPQFADGKKLQQSQPFLRQVLASYEEDWQTQRRLHHRVTSYKNGTVIESFQMSPYLFVPFPHEEVENLYINLEDFDLNNFENHGFSRCNFQEEFDNVYHVIINRDPYNWIASCFAKKFAEVYKNIRPRIETWRQHIKESLEETRILTGNVVDINYNRWFLDKNYRESIGRKLGLKFTDAGINDVSIKGDGSSFDFIKYDGKAQEMRVLERWKSFKDDDEYIRLLDDELKDLSRRYFDFKIEELRPV